MDKNDIIDKIPHMGARLIGDGSYGVADKEKIDALDEMNSIRVEIAQLMTRITAMNHTHKSREKSIIFSNLEVAHLYVTQDIETNHKL